VETPELRTRLVYQVRVFVKNPQDELRLGMPATVRVRLGQDIVEKSRLHNAGSGRGTAK
jgi:HlyD family secretion protein